MPEPFKLTRIPSLKTVADFKRHVAELGLKLPCDDEIVTGSNSPLLKPLPHFINGKQIGNRVAVQPMEGWDATSTGGPTADTERRWMRFGESGAKLIFGGEAMAVNPAGRANPNQLILSGENAAAIAGLRDRLVAAHRERYGTVEDLVVGFQLTHSGRFCRPRDKKRLEPRIAYHHPILDPKFGIAPDYPVLTDGEVEGIIEDFARAAGLARDAGADFVDIKHCHGYLLHEFLSAHTRPGKYGGPLENRTRALREIVQAIRGSGNNIEIAVRLSAFDLVPFRPDPELSTPGKPGPGVPEDYTSLLPYRYGFGCDEENPLEYDLREPLEFLLLCARLGIKLVNISAGSPYYNPHIQRPAAYPPSDGYQPAHDPLIDVARQMNVVHALMSRASGLMFVGSGYSYLQEFLPFVAQAAVGNGWVDMVGIGRMALSYPDILLAATRKGALESRLICRTFSDCTTAPRNGLISGCYPLDKYYAAKPEAQLLKQIKRPPAA